MKESGSKIILRWNPSGSPQLWRLSAFSLSILYWEKQMAQGKHMPGKLSYLFFFCSSDCPYWKTTYGEKLGFLYFMSYLWTNWPQLCHLSLLFHLSLPFLLSKGSQRLWHKIAMYASYHMEINGSHRSNWSIRLSVWESHSSLGQCYGDLDAM